MSNFWQALEARITTYDLLKHPFYQAWSCGELTAEDLREYATDYYHHVSAFPTYLSALHAQLPDGGLRRSVLENLMDEEGIGSPDARPHSDLWMDFAEGMGADAQTVKQSQPVAAVKNLIATFQGLMHEETAAALAALYAYESQVPRIAVEKAEGLQKHYGADARTCRYFTLHQTADVHHSQVWRDLIDRELAANPAAADAALNAADSAACALWAALDGVERKRQSRKAN